MSNQSLAVFLPLIVVFVLVSATTKLPEKIGFLAGRLMRVVSSYRIAHKRNARPVQVVSQEKQSENQVFAQAQQCPDWSIYDQPACRRLGRESLVLLCNT